MKTKKYYLKKSVYKYVTSIWLSIITIMFLCLIPFAIAINNIAQDHLGSIIMLGLYVASILNMLVSLHNIFISITDKGINFKFLTRPITTKWEHASGFAKDNSSSWIYKNQEGLLFTTGEVEQKPKNFMFRPMTLPEVFIPLSWFSNDWKNSEMMNQIKQYAPHLFEEKSVQSTD